MRWVGLDVGADELSVCILGESGTVIAEAELPNDGDSLACFLAERGIDDRAVIGMEAGSTTIHLHRKLRAAGFDARVFDTRQASKFLRIKQNKTDRNDARGIAEIARLGSDVVASVLVKSVECQKLRSELAIRQQMIRSRLAMESAVRAVLRLNGGKLKRCRSATGFRRDVTAELDRIAELEGVSLHAELEPAIALCELTRRNIEQHDRALEKRALAHEVCSRLMSVPGVGPISALSFYSAIEDPYRFKRNSAVGAYLGLAPLTRQSGSILSRRGISKMGNGMTREHLVSAATILLAHKKEYRLARWAASLKERAGYRSAQTALARKLAVLLIAIWKSGGVFSDKL